MDPTPQQSKFKSFISKISNLPLWIKQVIYIELKGQLEHSLPKINTDFTKVEDCLQLYVPKITPIGKRELELRAKDLPINVYKFVEGTAKEHSIIEIATNNLWSLAECSSYFISAMRTELVDAPGSNLIIGTALYMSGNIRLGEYFVKLGRLSIDELDTALRSQLQIEASTGEKKGMGEILLGMGVVSESDIEAILFLKNESQKRVFLDINASCPNTLDVSDDDVVKLKEKISLLTRENEQLKDQLRKILKVEKH